METYTPHTGKPFEYEDLLPCPFCGGTPEITFKGNDGTKSRSAKVQCKGCGVQRTVGAIRNNSEWCGKISIDKWNQRF